MKTDFDLIVHRLPECKEARVYVIGDLHVGAIEANIKGWLGISTKHYNEILEEAAENGMTD